MNAATSSYAMATVNGTDKDAPMAMAELGRHLRRLGLHVRKCGRHGYIFTPHMTGGLSIEGDELHFWDGDVNVFHDLEWAREELASMPDGAGYDRLRKAFGRETATPWYVGAHATIEEIRGMLQNVGVLPHPETA